MSNDNCNSAVCETTTRTATAQPPADIYETDADFRIAVDMPGISQDRVNVRLEQRELEVSGSFEGLAPAGAVERPFESLQFRRLFRLGEQVDTEKVEAQVKQGVLTVVLPKVAEAQPRRIEINAGE